MRILAVEDNTPPHGLTTTRNFNLTLWSRRIEAIPARQVVIGAASAIVAVGFADRFTGPMVLLTIFYLVPVAATAWIVGQRAADLLAFFAAITLAVVDQLGPLAEPKAAIAYVNDWSILIVFLFVNWVVNVLRVQTFRQRDLIQDVQRHLLPVVPHLASLDIAARWLPAWSVSGDYYDVIDAGPNQLAVCVAEASGKRMAAALIMSNVQATVRALASEGLPPERVLTALNRLLYQRLRVESFVTIFYGVLDTDKGKFTYSSAGHKPPMVRRRHGTLARLEPTGPIAGMFGDALYRSAAIDLGVNDRVVLYSDGVTEFANDAGGEFGESGLRAALAGDPAESAEQTCTAIIDNLQKFGGGRPYNDDVTLLVIVRRDAANSPEVPPARAAGQARS